MVHCNQALSASQIIPFLFPLPELPTSPYIDFSRPYLLSNSVFVVPFSFILFLVPWGRLNWLSASSSVQVKHSLSCHTDDCSYSQAWGSNSIIFHYQGCWGCGLNKRNQLKIITYYFQLTQPSQANVRWMCGVKLKNRLPSKELRERLGIDDIALVLQQNRLRWYGHVLRKDDDDWVKKCMEYEVEGPRPRGRPKRTWREVVWEDLSST